MKKTLNRCHESVSFHGKTLIDFPENKQIGRGSAFHNLSILGRGRVIIGEYCHFGDNVKIITQNHNYNSKHMIPYDNTYIIKETIIESFAWIGDDVLFTPGVRVGEGAIIGMGSVVSKDIPPMAIVGGNPTQIIKYRDPETFKKLKEAGKFN